MLSSRFRTSVWLCRECFYCVCPGNRACRGGRSGRGTVRSAGRSSVCLEDCRALRLERLRRDHPRRRFDCGEQPVDDWLVTKALPHRKSVSPPRRCSPGTKQAGGNAHSCVPLPVWRRLPPLAISRVGVYLRLAPEFAAAALSRFPFWSLPSVTANRSVGVDPSDLSPAVASRKSPPFSPAASSGSASRSPQIPPAGP